MATENVKRVILFADRHVTPRKRANSSFVTLSTCPAPDSFLGVMNSARLHATDSSSFWLIYREYLFHVSILGHSLCSVVTTSSRHGKFHEMQPRLHTGATWIVTIISKDSSWLYFENQSRLLCYSFHIVLHAITPELSKWSRWPIYNFRSF